VVLSPEQRFVQAALHRLGAPYLWGGRGYVKWSPTGLITHGFEDPPGSRHPLFCVDCSGLIACALYESGGPDWRATHNASALLEECEREQPPNVFGNLHFYGMSKSNIVHVAIALDHGLLLEAAGGDQSTTQPTPGKQVRIGYAVRNDFQEAGRLPLQLLLK
jgi:cell wall-associated NlpC family hydrolase